MVKTSTARTAVSLYVKREAAVAVSGVMGPGTWSKSRCGERKGEEKQRLEPSGKGEAGEKYASHGDSKQSMERPQQIRWQLHVCQGQIPAGSEDNSDAPLMLTVQEGVLSGLGFQQCSPR